MLSVWLSRLTYAQTHSFLQHWMYYNHGDRNTSGAAEMNLGVSETSGSLDKLTDWGESAGWNLFWLSFFSLALCFRRGPWILIQYTFQYHDEDMHYSIVVGIVQVEESKESLVTCSDSEIINVYIWIMLKNILIHSW